MILAIDLGGTRTKVGVVDNDIVLTQETFDTAPTADAALAAITEGARSVLRDATPEGVAMCAPGLIDEGGVIVSLPGKLEGIEGRDLCGGLTKEFGVRAIVVNDAAAYGAGEATAGAGKGFERVVVVTIGTGVGVSVMHRGTPITPGVFGGGIVGGFIPIAALTSGPHDTSGNTGTIEALCAAQRIAERCGTETVRDAYDAFERGDEQARIGIDAYKEDLTRALVALAHAHTPGCIVLGGGPITATTPLLQGLADAVNARLYGTYRVELRRAALADSAALVGCARLWERA